MLDRNTLIFYRDKEKTSKYNRYTIPDENKIYVDYKPPKTNNFVTVQFAVYSKTSFCIHIVSTINFP